MNSPEATIILKSPDGSWTTVGTETSRGIVPEGITVSANESGPDTCSFSLRREASMVWPDLLAFNKADLVIGGTLVWGGRIWEAPLSDGDEDVIAVQGRGWQYHLDDDLLQRMYVHTNMGAYVNQRDKPTAQLGASRAGSEVQAGSGALLFGWPKGFVVAVGDVAGVTLDLGSSLAKRAVVTWEHFGGADGNTSFFSRGSTDENLGGTVDDATVTLATASGTLSHTFAAARRYHHLFVYRTGGAGTFSDDQGVRVTSVKVFGDASYESGGASVLKASQVFADVLSSSALPLLDSSTAKIGTTAFSIPELAPSGYQTPRALMAAVNAYEGNLFGVTAERLLFLRERDEVPLTEVGAWPGSSFQDASTNSGEGLYNKVIVQGTGPSGAPIVASRYSGDVASTPASAFSDLFGVANPGFETNTASWTVISGALTRVTGSDPGGNMFAVGSAAARIDATTVNTGSVSTSLTGLTVGTVHAVRFQFRSPSPHVAVMNMTAAVLDGSVVLNEAADDSLNVPFKTMQVSFVATSTTATLRITTLAPGEIAAALVYIDDVHVYKVNASLLDRQGFTRTATLSVDSALTTTGATQLGDIWLSERRNPPLKGSLVVSQGGARLLNGGEVHPSEFLLRGGQLIRLGQLVDPSTGDQGREGIIKSVSYQHDTETASVELDNERGRLETLLSRLAVVTSQVR